METNLNPLSSNPNTTAFSNPALHAGSPPVAPVITVSAGVQQVQAAYNPIPPAVEDLLQLNPASRARSILNLAATPQQDDYFAGLAQNKSLDEKSRLLAASKIHCPVRRDTILSQLEQNSEKDDALNAAINLPRGEKRDEILAELAQNRTFYARHRLEAAKHIASETLREPILGELARTVRPDYRLAAVKAMACSVRKQVEAFILATDPALGIKIRWEAASMVPADQRKEALRALIDIAKSLETREERETVLLALTADHSLDIQDRIDAANALSGEDERKKALLAFAQDKRLANKVRWEAVQMLSKWDHYQELLWESTCDRTMGDYCGSAAHELVSGPRREEALTALALKPSFDPYYRYLAVKALAEGDNREKTLEKFAQDRNLSSNYRLAAAKALAPGEEQEKTLLALAKDGSIEFKDRWEAARALAAGPKKQEALLTIAKDGILERKDRIQAANAIASADLRKELLAHIG